MKKIMFAAAVAALFCSCAKDETNVTPTNEGKLVYRELTADIAPLSRAHLGEVETEGKIGVWLDKGDLVLFVNEEGTAATVAVDRTENGKVYFAGEMPTGTLKACYPAWAYDNDKRNYWDISQTDSQYGTLNIDKYQFAHEAVGQMNDLVNNAPNKDDEWRANSIPVAMTGAVATDADHFTFTADTNAAILEIPVTGDVTLQKICLYYTDEVLKPNGAGKTSTNHELHFINEQLTSEAKKFYIMVAPSTAKYICVEFQSSTTPKSATDLNTAEYNGNYTAGKNDLNWYNGRCFGYRYMRRVTSKAYAVNGITTMPTVDLTSTNLDANRYVMFFGKAHEAKNYGTTGYATGATWTGSTDDKVLGAKNTCTQQDDYLEVAYANNTGSISNGTTIHYRGDFTTGTTYKVPFDAGNYRYLAVKTNALKNSQNATYWTNNKGSVQLDTEKGKWGSRDCKDNGYRDGSYQNDKGHISYGKLCADGETEVLVFDIMSNFGASTFLSTTGKQDLRITFKLPDNKRTFSDADFDADGNCIFVPPTIKFYWMGFFTSIDEVSAFMANDPTKNK